MKTKLLIICILIGYKSYSQKISYNNLIGKWKSVTHSPNEPVLKVDFEDSNKVYIIADDINEPKQYCYIDTSYNLAIINMIGLNTEVKDKIDTMQFLIKYINPTTLKVQFHQNPQKIIWDKITLGTTGTLKKEQ